MSRESEQQYVDLKVWDLFRNRFKSPTTEASYWSDIMEFCRMTGKPFTETTRADVKKYYDRITDRMRNGIIRPHHADERSSGSFILLRPFSDGAGRLYAGK